MHETDTGSSVAVAPRPTLQLHDIFGSRMPFLDLAEGDKLAVVVVELHVGRGDSVMRSGIKIRYLLCSAKFEGTPSRRSPFKECHALTRTRSLLMSLSRLYRCFRRLRLV